MNMAKEGISKLEVRITNYSIWTTERKHTRTQTHTLNACMCTNKRKKCSFHQSARRKREREWG